MRWSELTNLPFDPGGAFPTDRLAFLVHYQDFAAYKEHGMTAELNGALFDKGPTLDFSEYRRDTVGEAFLDAAMFDLALKTHGNAKASGQFAHGAFGTDTIITPLVGGKQGVFKATSNMELNYHTDTTTIRADLSGAQGRRNLEITLDRSHNTSVVVKDDNDVTLFKTVGGWTPAPDNQTTAQFTLSDANTTLAKVQGTRTSLDGNHEKIQYTLYSPDDLKMNLGTIEVDKKLSGGILTMDVTINGK
jgi:hypothetical protein